MQALSIKEFNMSDQAILETVQELIGKVTGKKHIDDETDFVKDLQLNSFDIMNIVLENN